MTMHEIYPILIIDKGTVSVHNKQFEGKSFCLTPISWLEYQVADRPPSRENELDFHQIEYNHVTQFLKIRGAITGLFPLYYFVQNNLAVLAPSPQTVAQNLVNRGLFVNTDWVAVFEGVIFGEFLQGRTAYQGIRSIVGGHTLSIDLKHGSIETTVKRTFEVPSINHCVSKSEQNYIDEGVSVFESIWSNAKKSLANKNKVVIPFSSGLDSRLLALLATRDGMEVETVSMATEPGIQKSFEAKTAAQLASKLKLKNKVLPIKYLEILHNKDRYIQIGGGVLSFESIFFTLLYDKLPSQSVLCLGSFGGEIAGGQNQNFKQLYGIDRQDLSQMKIFDAVRKTFFEFVPEYIQECMADDIHHIILDGVGSKSHNCVLDYLRSVGKLYGLLGLLFSVGELRHTVVRPYVNYKYINSLLSKTIQAN